jgi:hypothetical protein
MPKQISFFDPNGTVPTMKFLVASGAVGTISPGTPTKFGSAGAIVPMTDGNGTTSERFTGIAKTTSTDTAAAAGVVEVFIPLPAQQFAAAAKSATAANTQAKIDALLGKRVVFDLAGTIGAGGQWTIDTAAGDAATNCVVIIGGEYQTNTVYFMYSPSGTFLDTR